MRLTPSCVAVFLSLCFDSFEYRPNACKTSSVVIGVVRIFAKCQRIVYFFANIPAEPGSSLQQRGFLCDLRRREARYQKSDALTESSLPHMECCRIEDCLIASHQGPSDTYPYVYAKDARQFSRSVRLRRRASRLSRVHGCLVPWHFPLGCLPGYQLLYQAAPLGRTDEFPHPPVHWRTCSRRLKRFA